MSDPSLSAASTPLANESVLIDPVRLAAALEAQACRLNVDAIAECDSTNARLLQQISQRATLAVSGSVLVADRQTAGRGRRGRRWHSAQGRPEDSLTFSLLWRFPPGTALSGLSLAVGLAIAEALAKLGCAGARLKWPNDLLVEEGAGFAKLGGILIELCSSAQGTLAVIGIGLNLRPPDELPDQPVVGLETLASSGLPERHLLLAAILGGLVNRLDAFSDGGFAPLRAAWESHHAFAGRQIQLIEESGQAIDARCLGVDPDGALRVETAEGVRRWLAGDVSLRLSGAAQ